MNKRMKRGIPVKLPDGREYPSIAAAARDLKVNEHLMQERIRRGWTVMQALGVEHRDRRGRKVKDHEGVTHNSVKSMCKAWGMNRCTFQTRQGSGWSVKRALTTPVDERYRSRYPGERE